MTTLTANIPESAKSKIERYIQRFGGKVVEVSEAKGMLPIEELEAALCEVKAIRDGKMPKLSLKEALRG